IMAPKIDFIDEINLFKETWKIKGGKIQATMKKSLINKFNCQLKEDVIGELTGIGNIEEWENNRNKTKRLTFELEDEQLFGGQEISSKIYQISTQSSYYLKEDLLQLTERKFFDEIRETRQDGDTDSFPEKLDNFLHKRFIFKIQISEFNLQQKWPIYTVIRVTDDDSLSEEYLSSSIVIINRITYTYCIFLMLKVILFVLLFS
ncbi:hypothetical protein Taro_005118, partial [Colocasia esculenta]|nr:hypothetical protein [Colocasia esculenta]